MLKEKKTRKRSNPEKKENGNWSTFWNINSMGKRTAVPTSEPIEQLATNPDERGKTQMSSWNPSPFWSCIQMCLIVNLTQVIDEE